MADTIREQIIAKLVTRSAVIKTTGGYNTNMGSNPFRAQRHIDPTESPCVNVWPQVESCSRQYGYEVNEMEVAIEGISYFASTVASADISKLAEQILGDLKKCFLDPTARTTAYGTLLDDIQYISGGVYNYPGEELEYTGARMNLKITYQNKIGDPYSQ